MWVRQAAHPLAPAAGWQAPGAIDIGFSQDMAVHHDQAILMARLVRDRASPAIRNLAAQIEISQVQDVGVLRGWLILWNQPSLPSAPMRWMTGRICGRYAVPDGTPMPGLATETELAALQTASGAELDRLFLRLMVRHHSGGLSMARAAAQGASLPAVRAMARNMQFEQAQEISYMTVLGQRLGVPADSATK